MPEQSQFEEQLDRESLYAELKVAADKVLHYREIGALMNTVWNHAKSREEEKTETLSLRQFLRYAILFSHFIDEAIFELPGSAAGYDVINDEHANLHTLIATLMRSGVQPESNDPRKVRGLGLSF